MNRRLVFVDIERRARQQVLLQRPGERLLVYHGAACGVDQIRRPLHACQRAFVDQVACLGHQGNVQRHHVRRIEQPIERDRRGVRQIDLTLLGIHHAHPERRRPRRDGTADPSDAHQPELLASELGAEQEIEGPSLPVAASQQALAFRQPPRDGQNQRPREVGDRLGQHIGRMSDEHATRLRILDIDVVVPDGDVRHDLQIRCGIDHAAVDRVGQQGDDRVLVGDTRAKLRGRHPFVARMHVDIGFRLELLDDR